MALTPSVDPEDSSRDGLRAVKPIEAWVQRRGGHPMAREGLFRAGHLHQGRGRDEEAAAYSGRIEALSVHGDMCVEVP